MPKSYNQLITSEITHKGNTDLCNYQWGRSPRFLMGKWTSGSERTPRITSGKTSKNFSVTQYLGTVVYYTLLTKVCQSQTLGRQSWVFYNSVKLIGNYWLWFCYPRTCESCRNFLGLIYVCQPTVRHQPMLVRRSKRRLEGMQMSIISQESELKWHT